MAKLTYRSISYVDWLNVHKILEDGGVKMYRTNSSYTRDDYNMRKCWYYHERDGVAATMGCGGDNTFLSREEFISRLTSMTPTAQKKYTLIHRFV